MKKTNWTFFAAIAFVASALVCGTLAFLRSKTCTRIVLAVSAVLELLAGAGLVMLYLKNKEAEELFAEEE